MQKIHLTLIPVLFVITWIITPYTLVAFIVGGTQKGGKLGKDMTYWSLSTALLGVGESLAFWAAQKLVEFYRLESWDYLDDHWMYD